jgi:hypothetical protein
VGKRRVAGTQDPVGPEVEIELLLQRLPDVDLRQHAEALLLQQLDHPPLDRVQVRRDLDAEAVAVALHVQALPPQPCTIHIQASIPLP